MKYNLKGVCGKKKMGKIWWIKIILKWQWTTIIKHYYKNTIQHKERVMKSKRERVPFSFEAVLEFYGVIFS